VLEEYPGGKNPYFATGAGGTLQALLFGFGGLHIDDQGIHQRKTQLPKRWKKLEIRGVGVDHATFTLP
jgi:trehalose/maltose hydrolase-like predicted phosphorylase